ncbi:hypothetical protein, partial [Stenotrophomonas sp.]|uniref:hypothetical protein n=1 Tax=Stenotrophomonas sp. TaxID=69392 RepID=UPI0028AD4509
LAAQRGEDDPMVQRADWRMADILGARVDPVDAGQRLAGLMARPARGGPEATLQQHAVQLAWARNLVRLGQSVEAERVLAQVVAVPGSDPRSQQLRWRARLLQGQLRCSQAPPRGRAALLELRDDVRRLRPEGGRVARSIELALGDCGDRALHTVASRD